ncbi:MAG: type toxin-antitoxin system ParD family antitoxin [Caulobacter sp.]|nr:type toxin-antitoxin system ParD family antitoxin [Caulobacter sp.]
MPTRNVVLTDRQSQMVDDLVAGGEYQNASEVLREGLRLVEARRKREADYSAWLRKEIQVGIDAADRGEGTLLESREDIEAFMNEVFEEAVADVANRK